MIKQTEEQVRKVWTEADCVCFDVDSTVCQNEAIDELANFVGAGAQVERLTKEAMGGSMSFRQALQKRLDIIKPSMKNLEDFNMQSKGCLLTPGIKELIDLLHKRKVHVYLVSGGFKITIYPVADTLNIDRENVFANELLHDEQGNYIGFCKDQPTSESGGKPRVMELLRKQHGYKTIVMIGDGMTDLESCPPADGFIGFGGNVVRENVKKQSSWFVSSFHELINELSVSHGEIKRRKDSVKNQSTRVC